jgi:ERCC4-type nuclease
MNKLMPIDIIIDSHEKKLIDALESEYLKNECNHLLFDVQMLDVGDVIYKKNNQLICLIERKTIDDYVSSITDGRSKNQSIRIAQLKKIYPDIIIIYLIEGPFINKKHIFKNKITCDSLYSSFINRVIRDQFTVYRTADTCESALVVTKIYDKLSEHTSQDTKKSNETIKYLKTIKLSKKDNMTPKNCYICQLAQIPGISIEYANRIASLYPSMRHLIMAYEKNNDKNNMLSEIIMSMTNNKSRKLGIILSKRIYEYIYAPCNDNPIIDSNKISNDISTQISKKYSDDSSINDSNNNSSDDSSNNSSNISGKYHIQIKLKS